MTGTICEGELETCDKIKEKTYNIEKVMSRKTVNGKKFILETYKSWIGEFDDQMFC